MRAAKARVEALKMRTANVFVAATKLLADIDVINGIRIILHAGRAQWTGFNELVGDLTTHEKSLELAQRWARQEWLQPLNNTLACLTDVPGLITCGFQVDFKMEEVRAISEDSPLDPLPRRLGAEAWAFGRLHRREAGGQYGAAFFLLPFQARGADVDG